MARQSNQANVQYCIQATIPGTRDIVVRFTIEQYQGPGSDNRQCDRIYNQVQEHITALSVRNNLDYEIVRWGEIKDRSGWIAGAPFED
jgi:hypothetical protein